MIQEAHSTLLFVTGASRSGTTMLNRVLGTHDRILGMNELHYFGDLWDPSDTEPKSPEERARLAASLIARQARGIWGSGPGGEELERGRRLADELPRDANGMALYAHVVRALALDQGKTIACEQTPRNIFYARRLLDLEPEARVIQLVRDPRSVIASQKNRWRRKKLGGSNIPWREIVRVWFNYHPHTMAKLWLRAADAGDGLVGHPRFLQVRFEDLVATPEEVVPAICAFVGVEFQPGMLEVPIVGSSQRQDKGQRGFSKESIESWKGTLSPAEVWMIERVAGAAMQRHGYRLSGRSPGLGAAGLLVRYPVHLAGVILSNPHRAWIQARAVLGRKG
jgi:hypothetical protein